jgi:hypothetical protein
MRIISIITLSLLLFAAIFTAGCHKHDDDNEVKISIMSPQNNAVITNPENVLIHVIFEATAENHDIEVKLFPAEQTANRLIDWDKHDHDKKIEFRQNIDLSSFDSGTRFVLVAESCEDHKCKKVVEERIEFSIQK